MKVTETNHTRHVVLRFDRGEELPAALTAALEEASVRAGWIDGFGTFDAAEVAVFDAKHKAYSKARRLEGGGDAVSLRGNVSLLEGATCVRLFATIARETDDGLSVVGGELLWGRAFSLELHVTVFEDVGLARVADERTGLPALVRPSGATAEARGEGPARAAAADEHRTSVAQPSPARSPGPRPADATLPSIVDMARAAMGEAPQHLQPPRRERPREDASEVYPEVGDIATHFHFGECKIISSDGDKIRLQQLKDLRVREVALAALRTELERVDAETGRRHFRLLRKN